MVASSEPRSSVPSVLRWLRGPRREGVVPALDGLRGVAILMVVLLHLCQVIQAKTQDPALRDGLEAWRPLWDLGRTGVHLFFVLSGYLLFLPWANHAAGGPRPSLRRYVVRRALRILPAYYVCLALIVALGWARWHLPDSMSWDVLLHVLLIHNWADATRESISSPFWTLAVEAQFYVVLPLLGVALASMARRFSAAVAAAALAVSLPMSLGLHVAIRWALAGPWYDAHSGITLLVAYWPLFGMGMLVALTTAALPRARPGRGEILLAPAVVLLILAHAFFLREGVALGAGDLYPFNLVMALCYGGLLWASLRQQRVSTLLTWRPLALIGVVSYSVYLWHLPLLERMIGPGKWTIATALSSVAGVAVTSFALVERPALTLAPTVLPRERRGRRGA